MTFTVVSWRKFQNWTYFLNASAGHIWLAGRHVPAPELRFQQNTYVFNERLMFLIKQRQNMKQHARTTFSFPRLSACDQQQNSPDATNAASGPTRLCKASSWIRAKLRSLGRSCPSKSDRERTGIFEARERTGTVASGCDCRRKPGTPIPISKNSIIRVFFN